MIKKSFIRLSTSLVIAVAGGSLPAQTASAPPDRPLVRVETELVLIDFVARDSEGLPVDDLKAGEIEVFEDGRARPIRSLQLVRRSGRPSPGGPGRRSDGRPSPGTASQRPKARLKPTRLVPYVFVLDLNALDTPTLQASKEAVREFLALHFSSSDRAALAVVSDSLAVYHPFDNDVSAFLKALDRVPSPRGILSYGTLLRQLTETYRTHGCPNCNPLQEAIPQTRDFFRQVTRRSRVLAESLSGLGDYLADLPGRKHVILFSAGYRFRNHDTLIDLLDAISRAHPPSRAMLLGRSLSLRSILAAKLGDLDEDSFGLLRKAARHCNAAQASIYSVDARGLTTNPHGTSDMWELNPGSATTATLSRLLAGESSAPQEFLQMSSEMTGGLTYLNRNDLATGALQALRDGSSYYVLAYEPEQEKNKGKRDKKNRKRAEDRYRRIRLKATRPGLTLRYRQGYFERPTPTSEDRLLNAFRFPGLHLDFAVDWRIHSQEGLEVEARIFTNGLECPQQDGKRHCLLELYGVLVDDRGDWVGDDYAFARQFPLRFDEEGWARLKSMTTVSAQAAAQAPAGTYELIAVVRQASSDRLSAYRGKVSIGRGTRSQSDKSPGDGSVSQGGYQ